MEFVAVLTDSRLSSFRDFGPGDTCPRSKLFIPIFRCIKTVSHREHRGHRADLMISPCSLWPLWLFIHVKSAVNTLVWWM